MLMRSQERVYRVGHLFCGIGAGAAGFNDANPRMHGIGARFVCAGGIDVDAGAIANFDVLTGARGTVMDLFDRDQYVAFHGHQPPAGWREATPADIRRAHGDAPLDVMFLSAPCKGFSGLLSAKASATAKYQALNQLTVRGIWLTLEAYKDRPIRVILFENVLRILTRGRPLLDRIQALLRAYGYVFAETTHNCGEIGGLAQSRNRMLMVARHAESVPPFLYQPTKSPLRGVGEVIGLLPLPGDPVAGAMHRVPKLQWKTWVRLAFVPAGKDWRALNDLAIENGHLRDFGIVPEPMRDNQLGVLGWKDTAPTLTGQRSPGQGRFSVADPRTPERHADYLGVNDWRDATGVIGGRGGPSNGNYSVADPRPQQQNQTYAQYGVRPWQDTTGAVTAQAAPGGGPNSVADPRLSRVAHSNVYRIARFDQAAVAVTSSREMAVADPRSTTGFEGAGKYRVTSYDEAAGTVIGGSTTGQGAFALADPRPTHGPNAHATKHRVVGYDATSPVVTGSDRVGSGAMSVADPRPVCLNAEGREGYATQGHYGVIGWADSSKTVPAYAKYDRGSWSVADPRDQDAAPTPALPKPDDRLVARIIAQDGTWHRPFTTLELAALQSIFDPAEVFAFDQDAAAWHRRTDFDLTGGSDQTRREWIGNAVPRAAARGMAETIGETLLLADLGETFTLSSRAIWTKPLAMALAVDPRQPLDWIEA